MRKPFLSKATCSSTNTEFLHRFFPGKMHTFSKNVQQTNAKSFSKIISKACFEKYFYRYVLKVDETYL